MNSFQTLKIFATALLVAVLAGPVIQRLLPGWAALAGEVGSGGAWFASIMYHIVYGIIIGVGAALAVTLLGRFDRVLTLPGAVIAALASVLLFDAGYVLFKPQVETFTWLALILVLISFAAHGVMGLIPTSHRRVD
ncbi:hypothetical protein [Sedimenticola hydrogenitrophicus]|uniref:hypothetical protein n=1 Tax=Sedimenticola hydrogenitrophicus TaxID=2967975 RepID=UPI0021A87412|nr:hypothetical protein [Sedimenticola hydrogenitrophicus]